MLFNSVEYFLFLPAVVTLFFILPSRFRWILLLGCSYFFYMYWRPEYAILLLTSTIIDYVAAFKIQKSEGRGRKAWLVLSLLTNLGLLIAFKYFGFLTEGLNELFYFFESGYTENTYDILIPVGISFYTFQSLSYTIDVYRKRREPETHFGIFALYVSFFPQLIAGPIERSTRLLPQFREPKKFKLQNLVDGGRLIVWGLFKKILIADTLAIYTFQVIQNMEGVGGAALLLTFFVLAFQIYFDFAAYTDMAIGSAKIMGFELMSNFERFYVARTVSGMWSRWHISLTSWLFDYLYRPLAKKHRLNWQLNIMIVFLAMGIWHGAGWGFIIFGLLNGFYYIISYYLEQLRFPGISNLPFKWISLVKNIVVKIVILIAMSFSLGFWHTDSWDEVTLVLNKVFLSFNFDHSLYFQLEHLFLLAATIPLVFFVELQNGYLAKKPFHTIRPKWLRWGIYYYIILFLLMFGDQTGQEFYYFQF